MYVLWYVMVLMLTKVKELVGIRIVGENVALGVWQVGSEACHDTGIEKENVWRWLIMSSENRQMPKEAERTIQIRKHPREKNGTRVGAGCSDKRQMRSLPQRKLS